MPCEHPICSPHCHPIHTVSDADTAKKSLSTPIRHRRNGEALGLIRVKIICPHLQPEKRVLIEGRSWTEPRSISENGLCGRQRNGENELEQRMGDFNFQ